MNQAKKQNAEMVQLIEKQHVQKLIHNRKSAKSSGDNGSSEVSDGIQGEQQSSSSSSSNKRKYSSCSEAHDPRFVLPSQSEGSGSVKKSKKGRSSEGQGQESKRGRTFHQAKVLGINHGEIRDDDA